MNTRSNTHTAPLPPDPRTATRVSLPQPTIITGHRPWALWVLLALCLTPAGCQDDDDRASLRDFVAPPPPPPGPPPPEPPPELDPPPVADVCQQDEVRCILQGRPEIESCQIPEGSAVEARRWVEDRCPDDQVCVGRECRPFACNPGQPVCSDLETLGTCNEAGDGIDDPQACGDGQVCRNSVCIDLCAAVAEDRSYIGCNYLVVDLPNPFLNEGSQDSPFGLVVANPDPLLDLQVTVLRADGEPEAIRSQVTVQSTELVEAEPQTVNSTVRGKKGELLETLSGLAQDVTIPAGGFATLLLPRDMLPLGRSGIFPAARKLVSTRPAVVYQYNPYCCNFSFTNDASLLLPVEALGTQYIGVGAPDWPKIDSLANQFGMGLTIVASEPDTQVSVSYDFETKLFNDPDGRMTVEPTPEEGELATAQGVIQPGEVMHVESLSTPRFQSELTGARIEADKPVAVFSTHPCTNIPHGASACDHLEEQLIPTDTWGDHYLLTPPSRRSALAQEVVYWRLVAGDEGAEVQLNDEFANFFMRGSMSTTIEQCTRYRVEENDHTRFALAPGQDCMLSSRYAMEVRSNAPLQIMGFLVGEEAATSQVQTGTGDPSMFLLPPVAQFRREYLFLTPETYALDYVTVVLPKGAAGGITLDGMPVDPQAEEISGDVIEGTDFVSLHIPVSDGAHAIEAEVPFGLLVYAYDRFVSYAYTGGLNLIKRGKPPQD